jgi:hypothetical protein
METSRLLALAPVLADEVVGARETLQSIREALKMAKREEISAVRSIAEQHLRAAPSMHFVPSWLHLVHRIGGRTLHAREVLRRLGHILDDDDLKSTEKATLIESLQTDLSNFEITLRKLESALRAVNETARTIPTGKAEIGVLYPKQHFADLEEFAREVGELNRHIRPFIEVSGDTGSPALASLETGTFEIFLTTGTATGALVATVIWRLLRTWKQIEEIRKLRAETRKIDAEASELLEKRAQRQREEAVGRIHKEVMTQCDEGIDEARRNELSISVKQSIAFVDTRIQLNVLFEVAPTEMPPRQTSAGEREAKETKLIRERGTAMQEIQASIARPLLPVDDKQEELINEDGGA